MLLGGSIISRSVTCEANTVAKQVSPSAKSASGLSVKVRSSVVVRTKVWLPLVEQESVNAASGALTGSLNVTLISLVKGTIVAESAGLVLVTVGAASAAGQT